MDCWFVGLGSWRRAESVVGDVRDWGPEAGHTEKGCAECVDKIVCKENTLVELGV